MRLTGLLVLLIASAIAWPAQAAADGWRCEASALRATVLSGPPVEPAVANAGGSPCRAASAGGESTPALPLALSASGLDAETGLDGPVAGPAREQAARAEGGAAELRVLALPELPLELPEPDFGDVEPLEVPGVGSVDLRPALEALVRPRSLPATELLAVRAARAEAAARCVDGVPRLAGSSSLAAVVVGGVPLGLDRAVTETVRLIDSQSIDPSDVDIARLVPGVDLTPLQGTIQAALDELPEIAVPPTIARVRVTPGERIENGVRLTQRALTAEIAIAGQRLAHVVVGEATVGVDDVACGGVADLALRCTKRRLTLIDVYAHRGRVRLLGAADRRYVGRRVRVRFTHTGRTVARPRVRRDGTFRATAALPPRGIRGTNRARYQAAIRGERSMALKLTRRMLVTRTRTRGRHVVIAGRVVRPLADPVAPVEVRRRVSCKGWRTVERFRPRRDGRFRVRLRAPKRGEAAVYRMSTRVKLYDWFPKLYPTFTLPRYVELG